MSGYKKSISEERKGNVDHLIEEVWPNKLYRWNRYVRQMTSNDPLIHIKISLIEFPR